MLFRSFKRALQDYQEVEKKSRDKYRQRMERQIRIGPSLRPLGPRRAAFVVVCSPSPRPVQSSLMRPRRRSRPRSTTRKAGNRSSRRPYAPCRPPHPSRLPTNALGTSPVQLVQSRQQGARAAFAEVQSRNQDLRKCVRPGERSPRPSAPQELTGLSWQDRGDDHAARADDAGHGHARARAGRERPGDRDLGRRGPHRRRERVRFLFFPSTSMPPVLRSCRIAPSTTPVAFIANATQELTQLCARD